MLCFTCEEITDAHVSLETILLYMKPHCDALVTKNTLRFFQARS